MPDDRIRRNPDGTPTLTKMQVRRVHKYAVGLLEDGSDTTAPAVPVRLLAACLLELVACLNNATRERLLMLEKLRQLADDRTRVVPVSYVAELSIVLMRQLTELPTDAARTALLTMLREDFSAFVLGSTVTGLSAVDVSTGDVTSGTKH